MKVSEEELFWLSDCEKHDKAANKLLKGNVKLLVVTCGNKGAIAYKTGKKINASGFQVEPIDTTGAGENFWGVFLSETERLNNLRDLNDEKILKALYLGNAAGALCVGSKGAVNNKYTRSKLKSMVEGKGIYK